MGFPYAPAQGHAAPSRLSSPPRGMTIPMNGKKTLDTLSKCLYVVAIHVLQFNRIGLWALVLNTMSGKQVLEIHSHRPLARHNGKQNEPPLGRCFV